MVLISAKVNFGFIMTMIGFSMAFVVAEVIPLLLVTVFTVIAYDLNAINSAVWLVVAPLIAVGAVSPFVGSLSDALGRKSLILASLGVTVVSMAILGSTHNLAVFFVGEVLAGAGIGVQILTILAAASEIVPVAKRGAVIGYIVLGFVPFAPASLYGQYIAETSWRWIFLLVGIWTVLSFVVLAIWYKPPPVKRTQNLSTLQILARMDYVGNALLVLGLVLFCVGLNWGGQTHPWKSTQVIGCLASSVVSVVLFVLWEKYGAKYPLFPMELVKHPRYFIAVSVLCLTSGVNYVPITVFWTIQCYAVYGASFRQAGVWLLPLGFCIAGGAGISAIMITVFKRRVHWVLLGFCIMQTVGMACMAIVDPTDIRTVWGPMVVGLFGIGAVLLPSQVVFSVISPDHLIGTSVAFSLVIRMVGQIVGKSMFYNIFREHVRTLAPPIIGIPAINAGFQSIPRIEEVVTVMAAGPLSHYRSAFPEIVDDAKMEVLVQAGRVLYGKAFPLIYYVSIPFGVLAVLSCFALWGIEQFLTDHVAVHLV
ncbi:putative major facilitator superfamily transporter [Pseudovirgaria hyperparasitica]|uniref:Major facilitator superfamily transporter n=1 Tax=Pseudovirgaria hyperparasitica TaxID=470096 RepID=A0A6A6WHM0_9PEZI|nr:putative major facilitator superfamily transporter [Pseudovirgaria hyperparasitica]KAF2762288.1 putative major facilitator superfamily transporter [Pseudovirgaria hyperparasitica]